MTDTQITDTDVEEVLQYLTNREEAERFTHNHATAKKTRRVIQVIHHLRRIASGTTVRCWYYVADLVTREITKYPTQSDIASTYHETNSTISEAIAGERAISLGRYFISRSRERAEQLMAEHPAPITRPRRIDHIDVETLTGALVKRYDSVRAFAMDYDLNVSTAYALIRRYPSRRPGEIYGYPDRRVRTTYRT